MVLERAVRPGRWVLWVEYCFDVGLGSDLSAFSAVLAGK